METPAFFPPRIMTLSRRRPSYTLLELMLVTALIAIVSALAFPSMDSMYGYFKLNAAVDSVRAAWVTGRGHAIEEGVPYRFAVVPGQGNYRLAPEGNDYWSGGTPAPSDPENPPAVLEDALPKGVCFAMSNGPAPEPGPNDETSMPVGQVDPGAWSPVAVFMPDGTAREDVEIVFQVKGARPMSIHLRALTGAITVKTLEAR
jgi:type II secretory pathway pseudopilin PulG